MTNEADGGDPARSDDDSGAVGRPTAAGSAPAGLDRPLGHTYRPLRTAITAVVLALLAVAGVVAAFVGAGPARADRAVLGDAIGARSPALTTLASAITTVGSTASMGLLAVLVGLWLMRRRRPVDAVFVVGTMAGASLLFTGVKRLLDRPRPPLVDQLVSASNESLPSGHATMAVAVLGSLVVLAWHGRTTGARLAMVAAALLWAGAVGLTRVYLGVHWFSDVLAGWLVGGAWLAVCATAWSWHRSRSR
jgi:uncharacterized protein (TIGR03382 family)